MRIFSRKQPDQFYVIIVNGKIYAYNMSFMMDIMNAEVMCIDALAEKIDIMMDTTSCAHLAFLLFPSSS